MAIHILPTNLSTDICSRLGIKDLYRCKRVCWGWYDLIRRESTMIEIFLRLPVQSLLRFKSVSRYYYNLISDMDFVRLHHKYQARLNPSVIVMDEDSMYCALLNPKAIVLEDSSLFNDYHVKQLDIPQEIGPANLSRRFVGCCNGLICYYCHQFFFMTTDCFFLYNPATRAFSLVPSYAGNSYTSGRVSGFGYDCKEEDHKIVVIETNENAVFIYSLRTNSWRKAKSSYPPGSAPCVYSSDSVFVNNAFHWTFNLNRIMSFDLSTEQYHEVPMPELKHKTFRTFGGGVLLSAPDGLHLHLLHPTRSTMDLWIMKEYGVQQSWAKLFSITREVFDDRQSDDPLLVAYLKGKSQILLGSTQKPEEPVDFLVYEFKTKKVEKLAVLDGLPELFRARDPDELPNESVPIAVAQWAESLYPL